MKYPVFELGSSTSFSRQATKAGSAWRAGWLSDGLAALVLPATYLPRCLHYYLIIPGILFWRWDRQINHVFVLTTSYLTSL